MSKEAMKLALEALERVDAIERGMVTTSRHHYQAKEDTTKAITDMREALAEQPAQQEPVGIVRELFTQTAWEKLDVVGSTKVYLAAPQPAQQEPDELTDEQIDAACEAGNIYRIDFIRAYKAAHNIKEQP